MFQEWKQLVQGLRPHLVEMRKQASEAWIVVKTWWRTAYNTKFAIMIGAAIVWILSGLQIIARPPIAGYLYFGTLAIIVFVATTSPGRRTS